MQNLFDKASLVMVPSGYDNGKLYNIKPEDKGSAFEFERATMATRVNSSGLVETMFPEATNLLLQSNQFDEGVWSKFNEASLSHGVADPFGGSNAWELDFGASNDARISQSVNLSIGTPYSFSVWARVTSGTKEVRINAASSFFNKTLTTNWQRIEANQVATNASVGIQIRKLNSEGDYTIQIYGAQLESGYFATPYIDTTTETVTRQNQANQPRIDYTSGEGALLLEPGRTNELPYSENFDEYSSISNINLTSNAIISPDGTQNATKLESTIGTWLLREFMTTIANVESTISLYVKAVNPNANNTFRLSTGGNNHSSDFTATDQWQRFEHTATSTGGTVSGILRDTASNDAELYIWGMQVEIGSYATSYIPTNGQQVTRAYEFCRNHDAADLIGQTEGTLFIDLNVTTLDPNSFLFGVYGGSPTPNEIYIRNTTSNRFSFVHYHGSTQAQIITNTVSEGRHKLAACYKNNDWALYLDGELVGTDTSGSFVGGMFRITFGYYVSSVYQAYESVNNAILFKSKLTDEELQRLTSPSADATTFTELANNNGYTIL